MLQSHVIDIQGVFAGAAIRTARNFRLVAVHPTLADLHHSEFPSLSDIRQAVSRRMRAAPTGREARE